MEVGSVDDGDVGTGQSGTDGGELAVHSPVQTGIDERRLLLNQIEIERGSKTILYVTGDRQGLETMIGNDIIDLFVDHLDALGPVEKISLVLYTMGGNTSAAWNLVNLLHMFCDDLEVIAPGKCMSAGTLISLGADRIVMTKQATLGPIDPTLQHPLGPSIPGASPESRAGVSVEAVRGYLDAIAGYDKGQELVGTALLDLSSRVHPLVLGQIFRSQQQIRNLAQRLLSRHTDDEAKSNQIIEFLCSESGSHDYTLNRREAKELGLVVEKCSAELYELLKALRHSYSSDLALRVPYDMNAIAGRPGESASYTYTRALIESPEFGAHQFVSEGEMVSTQLMVPSQPNGPPVPQTAIQDKRTFEGWRKVG